jgi:hypothetical protein
VADRLHRLEKRRAQHDAARRSQARADRAVEAILKEIDSAGEEIEKVYGGAGLEPGSETELLRRLDLLAAWAKLRDELRDKRVVERETEQRLGDRSELLSAVEAGDESALLRQLHEAQTLASERERLSNEIHTIENAIVSARAGGDLEAARAGVAACVDSLETRLEEEGFAEVAGFLLADVEREHTAVSRPAVLRRAEEWFARFTRHAFELNPPGLLGRSFVVRESATGEDRTPDQLSSGTRMQLFLSLRLAFALEAERGCEPLPLFLDEALTVTDPERFRSVAECVHSFAQEQERQVFYLTAQPHDVRALAALGTEPRLILLHEVRRLAAAMPDPSDLELPPLEAVPTCEGRTAEEYGEILQVPRVTLWDPAESLHLFHLLRDELKLLERLLDRGVCRVGQLRNLLGTEIAASFLSPEEREELRWRSAVVDAFLEAARQGRGRPVDRTVLEDAQVSPVFIDRLASLAEELNGDASALLEAMDARQDSRVKRFHARQREHLQTYFEEQGHLDTRPTLGLREIELRLLAAATADIERGAATPERVAALTRFLAATAFPDGRTVPIQTWQSEQ